LKSKLKPEDRALFRKAVRGVKPLTGTKTRVPPSIPIPKQKKITIAEEIPSDSFSDHEYLDAVDSEDKIFFSQPGTAPQTIRLLKRGAYAIEAVLDLHGKIIDEARIALHEFILECQAQDIRYVLIVHGKGHGKKPILKNKVNHWLREASSVLAFSSAKPRDGGNGALYVYLKGKSNEYHK
jgi:DNA-nicking Smr family endonuclease